MKIAVTLSGFQKESILNSVSLTNYGCYIRYTLVEPEMIDIKDEAGISRLVLDMNREHLDRLYTAIGEAIHEFDAEQEKKRLDEKVAAQKEAVAELEKEVNRDE